MDQAQARPARVRAALFDVDGTLVDTNDLHAEAWREAFARFGVELEAQAIRGQIGKGGDNLIPALAPQLDKDRRAALEEHRAELFKRDYLPRAVPFPGVRALFERLAADGVKIVLASSAGAEEVRFHLSLIGCEDLVDGTTSADDAESSKPDPDIFQAALTKAGIGPEEAVVVGDTPWDVLAASKAGLRTLGFRSGGFAEAELTEAGAAELYDGPADLLARYDRSVFAHG
jgi:HAD superfamily hydrolase (TIGR01509 family)